MRSAAKFLIAALLAVTYCGPAFGGTLGGPGEISTCVEAFSSDLYVLVCYADEPTTVIVEGDGDTDLDLYVYDENGYLVASDTDLTDFCWATWTPRWTGVFYVVVENLGSVYNAYSLQVD
jgi:hypothetical protein